MTHQLHHLVAAPLVSAGLLLTGALGAPSAQAATTVVGTATRTLTIRSAAADSAQALGRIETGQRIPATAKASNGWVRVRFHLVSAYVHADQLNLTGVAVPPRPASISTSGTKVATGRLTIRSGPYRTTTVVGHVAEGRTLRLTGRLSHGYAETRYASHLRWVSVLYLGTLAAPRSRAATALAYAQQQLGKPYAYGAAGPSAFDCSGLTSAAWKAAGVSLPRTAASQFSVGTPVAKADLRPGDLVFFYGAKPGHVAVYVGEGRIIHAPQPGRTVEYSQLAYMPFSGARRVG